MEKSRRLAAHTALAAALALGAACGRDSSGTRVPLDQTGATAAGGGGSSISDAARAALARGNDAFRAKRYEDALGAYREAVAAAPGDAAPYYGIQMAAVALGRAALADSAAERIRVLSPGSSVGGENDPHSLPPDHPRIKVQEDVRPAKKRS